VTCGVNSQAGIDTPRETRAKDMVNIDTSRTVPWRTAVQKHAMHCTYLALIVGALLLIASFWFSLHWAWFLRGVIAGMFAMVAVAWMKSR
jgi:hypothetical protein